MAYFIDCRIHILLTKRGYLKYFLDDLDVCIIQNSLKGTEHVGFIQQPERVVYILSPGGGHFELSKQFFHSGLQAGYFCIANPCR